jgi:hypothetical protein
MTIEEALRILHAPVNAEYQEAERERRAMSSRVDRLRDTIAYQAREPFKRLKKHIRSLLKFGKHQCILFHGDGFCTSYHGSELIHVSPSIRATIYTGVQGLRLSIEWQPMDEGELDKLIEATKDALQSLRPHVK